MKGTSRIISAFAKTRIAIAAYGALVMLALSPGVNVYLGLLVIRPKSAPTNHSLPVGARFPSLAVHDLAGKEIKMTWPSSESKLTAVYVFSPAFS